MAEAQEMSLRNMRLSLQLSQQKVADVMGVSRPRVSQIEADFPNVRYDVVEAYIEALGGRVQFKISGIEGAIRAAEVTRSEDSVSVRKRHGDRAAIRERENYRAVEPG